MLLTRTGVSHLRRFELLLCDRGLSNLRNLTSYQDYGGPLDLSSFARVLRSRPHVQFGLDSLL